MQEIYFMARHVPFWAIPMVLIAGEFAYLFWLRRKLKWASLCVVLCLFGLLSNIFYIYAGGPEKSVKSIKRFQQGLER